MHAILNRCGKCGKFGPIRAVGFCLPCFQDVYKYKKPPAPPRDTSTDEPTSKKLKSSNIKTQKPKSSKAYEFVETKPSITKNVLADKFSQLQASTSKYVKKVVASPKKAVVPRTVEKISWLDPYDDVCFDCCKFTEIYGDGVCKPCLSSSLAISQEPQLQELHSQEVDQKGKRKSTLKKCTDCGDLKPHAARGRCHKCYKRLNKKQKEASLDTNGLMGEEFDSGDETIQNSIDYGKESSKTLKVTTKRQTKPTADRVGIYPLRLLVIAVKVVKMINAKTRLMEELVALNDEGERMNWNEDNCPNEFRERYTEVLNGMKKVNHTLDFHLDAMSTYDDLLKLKSRVAIKTE